ncbi:hypothetical protein AABB24_018597, partial [Solanum stoloniferum]
IPISRILFPELSPSPYIFSSQKSPLSHQTLFLSSPIDLSLLCQRFRLQTTEKWQFPVVINISPHAIHQSYPSYVNFTSLPSSFLNHGRPQKPLHRHYST